MDDSQERWREELDTRNDMGQEFSNEETDVRGEIRTPRERATELISSILLSVQILIIPSLFYFY
jgi:hypothetical protein